MTPEEIKLQEENTKILMDIQAKYLDLEKGRCTKTDLDQFKANVDVRWADVEKELARLKAPRLEVSGTEPTAERKAFNKFLRKGMSALTPEEHKALTLVEANHAGVLAPAEYVNQIYHYASVMHPIRTVASVRQTERYEVQFPVNDAGCIATWVAEGGTKTETTAPTYALTTIVPQKMQILLKATTEWLDDQVFNAEAEIALQAGRALGALESTAFFSGNGTTTGPEGLNTNATIAADHINTVTDNTLAFDDFIIAQYTVEEPYIPNASWLLNRTTLGVCVGLKSATTNTYLLVPNLQAGQPATILGSPVYTWSAVTACAASTNLTDDQIILLYGDFRQGYMVIDRMGMTIQRLNELYAATGYVGFLITARVGGGVIIPPAIQILRNQKS